jgi:hypothetical protein
VDVRVNAAKPLAGWVVRVHQDRTYFGSLFGQRIILDVRSQPGDSGALVVTANGEGIGIYRGTIPDGRGGLDGICQDLYQVETYFSLDLFD